MFVRLLYLQGATKGKKYAKAFLIWKIIGIIVAIIVCIILIFIGKTFVNWVQSGLDGFRMDGLGVDIGGFGGDLEDIGDLLRQME